MPSSSKSINCTSILRESTYPSGSLYAPETDQEKSFVKGLVLAGLVLIFKMSILSLTTCPVAGL